MLPEKSVISYVSTILQERNVPGKFSLVMAGILSRAYYNQDARCMEIVTNTYVKKEIAKKAGMKSPGPVSTGLNKLTEAGFLDCVENGVYRLNPVYFGSRPWSEVQEIRIQRCFGVEEKFQILAVYSDTTEVFTENKEIADNDATKCKKETLSETADTAQFIETAENLELPFG